MQCACIIVEVVPVLLRTSSGFVVTNFYEYATSCVIPLHTWMSLASFSLMQFIRPIVVTLAIMNTRRTV